MVGGGEIALETLLELVRRLLLLHARGAGLVAEEVARRVNLEHLRLSLGTGVDARVDGDHTQCAHEGVLRVELGDVGHTLCQMRDGDRVAVLVLELGGFMARALDNGLGVGDHTGGNDTDVLGDAEHVGDGGSVDELVSDLLLGDEDDGRVGADGHRGDVARTDGLERVLCDGRTFVEQIKARAGAGDQRKHERNR